MDGSPTPEHVTQTNSGAHRKIRTLHEHLDKAIFAAYGWDSGALTDADIIQRLIQMNGDISAGRLPYDPFDSAPGSTVRLF